MDQLQQLPSLEDWGWKMVGEKYFLRWTDLAEVAIAIRELIKCNASLRKVAGEGKFQSGVEMHRAMQMEWCLQERLSVLLCF